MESNLDNLRASLDITEMESDPTALHSISVETLRALENRRIFAEGDYEEDFDTLSNLLVLQSSNLLHEALATATGRNLDPELAIKASDLSRARDEFTHAQSMGYGPSNDVYKAAANALTVASNAYEARIDGIMTGLKTTSDTTSGCWS